ncbi:MAG: repeat protein [Polyangiaceae bacterium]|nr:repeat protein [Polyangiaceae bacterium]
MRALDELLNSWRSNPDADATIAVCSYLGSSKRDELIREVGASAETWHAGNGAVMLAVGRMYLDAGMLQEAQTSLVAAGKADARDARPFRYLGEVLLRRGDAVRADKVLARAMQLGGADEEVELWHERAVLFSALQKRVGAEAVAAEVSRSMPRHVSVAPPPGSDPLPSFGVEESTKPRNEARPAVKVSRKPTLLGLADANPLPRFDSAPGKESADPIRVSDSELLDTPPSAPGLPPPPAAGSTDVAEQLASSFLPSKLGSRPQVSAAGAAARPAATLNKPNLKQTQVGGFQAAALQPSPVKPALPVSKPAPLASKPAPLAAAKPPLTRPQPATAGAAPPRRLLEYDDAVTVITPPPFNAQQVDSVPPPPPPAPVPAASPAVAFKSAAAPAPALPLFSREAETVAPFAAPPPPALGAPAPVASRFPHVVDTANPTPAVVMDHLARVGLYEPGGGAAPAWETPPKQRSRGALTLLVATLVIAAAGGGAYAYSRKVKAERAQEAETLNVQVEKLLKSGSISDLRATDDRLTRSFELDSRSQRAGRLWLRNRVLNALLLSGETRGIDAAVYRGRTVGLPEKELLVGKVASFFVEGDVAGGAALLVAGDKSSGTDAYYQLAAGAVLERAGDPRALERYAAAVQLAPELLPAEMLHARLLLLEAGPEAARPVIESLRKKGETPVTRALSALSWVLAPNRPDELPADAQLQPGDAEKLPAPLAAVPAMVDAARALNKQDLPAASKSIDSAIGVAMTPALAAGLGFLAIEAGDEVVARKAALRALQFSGVYPKARTLAARVALLGGRIDEAQKAIEGLDPASADVAVVRAVVAYESLESADLKSALEALGNSAVGSAFSALDAAAGVVSGSAFPTPAQIEELAAPEKPWGELVAVDAAIETGNLPLAEKLLAKRSLETLRPVHLRRLARLRRLQGKLDEALQASAASAEGGIALPLLLERVYELLAKEDVAAAKQLAAKYPSLLGPLAGWVGVLTDVASKQAAAATVRLTKLDLPPDESPIAVRVLVARALMAAGDKRAKPYLGIQLKKLPKNPDLLAAATIP